jgi:glucose/mannose transport system substrate-binding protein
MRMPSILFTHFRKPLQLAATALALAGPVTAVWAGDVEVLHYWTSGGEARSVEVLKKTIEARGHKWRDFAVAGGGGDTAMSVLKSRVLAGNPPSAAQIKGPSIQEWAQLNVLANLDSVAEFEGWDKLLPKVVADVVKYHGTYVAAPVNVHRVNWLWINPEVMKKSGVTQTPNTWAEFFQAADKMKAAGFVPLAHGGQNWQDFTMFESVVLGTGGAAFYQDALVKLSPAALGSIKMRTALETFRKLKAYTDKGSPGRDWNLTTAMVIQGKAGFQFMGDWAKGEFLAASKVPGKDFICTPAPGSANAFTFNIDSFAMFRLRNVEAQKAQGYLAASIMAPQFQEVFNLNKGSIPVRQGVSMAKFDDCARTSVRDFEASAKAGTLVPSVAHGMALRSDMEGAMKDVVSQYWTDSSISVEQAMASLQKLGVQTANAAAASASNTTSKSPAKSEAQPATPAASKAHKKG